MPNDSFVLFALAKEYESQGEHTLALEKYEELMRIHPNYVGLYYHLGKLHERENRRERALEIFSEGMKIAKAVSDQHAFSELAGARMALDENAED